MAYLWPLSCAQNGKAQSAVLCVLATTRYSTTTVVVEDIYDSGNKGSTTESEIFEVLGIERRSLQLKRRAAAYCGHAPGNGNQRCGTIVEGSRFSDNLVPVG